jgi:hypothetical protein
MFSSDVASLEGRTIWSLLFETASRNASHSYRARHLAYLARDGAWRHFIARDPAGWRFPVEISVSMIGLNESTGFMVHLRQLAATGGARQSTH